MRRTHPAPMSLVEEHVRDRTDQLQIAPPVADQLVPGRERDQRLEGHADGHRSAIGHEAVDGFVQRQLLRWH